MLIDFNKDNKLSIIFENNKGSKATKCITFDSSTNDLDLLNQSFVSFYNTMTIDVGLESELVDNYISNIVCQDNKTNIEQIPTFDNIDEFLFKINRDIEFRQFMYDFFKESFNE